MESKAEYVIERLLQSHDLSRFDCGNEALNLWLKRFAWTNVQSDSARVYVLHRCDKVVLGYHALTAGSIGREEAPQRIAKGLAAHPIAVAVLGRLAVDSGLQGLGLGVTLLQDALERVEQAGDMIAIRAVLAQAISEQAKKFYSHFGFIPSPVDEMRMLLLMKDLRSFIRSR